MRPNTTTLTLKKNWSNDPLLIWDITQIPNRKCLFKAGIGLIGYAEDPNFKMNRFRNAQRHPALSYHYRPARKRIEKFFSSCFVWLSSFQREFCRAFLYFCFLTTKKYYYPSIFKKPFGGPTYKIKHIMMNPSNNTVINPSDESLSDSLSARDDEKTIPFLR